MEISVYTRQKVKVPLPHSHTMYLYNTFNDYALQINRHTNTSKCLQTSKPVQEIEHNLVNFQKTDKKRFLKILKII